MYINMNDKEILERAKEIKKEKAKAKKKAYKKEYNQNKAITKGLQFNKNTDKDIIDHINKLDQSFNSYIKELIRKDMKNHE